jgi:hypothetical protein
VRDLDAFNQLGIEVRVDCYMPENMIAVLPKDPWHQFTAAERDEITAAQNAAGDDTTARSMAGFVAMARILGGKGVVAVARNLGTKLGLP